VLVHVALACMVSSLLTDRAAIFNTDHTFVGSELRPSLMNRWFVALKNPSCHVHFFRNK